MYLFKCSKLLVNKEHHKHISKFEPEKGGVI
jgi:hypothetical protein